MTLKNKHYETPIIFLGAIFSGKSTIAQLLSERIMIRRIPMDRVRWYYYFKYGYDLKKEKYYFENNLFDLRDKYWKFFDINTLEDVLIDFKDSIIDLGAGHSFYENEEYFLRAKKVFNKLSNTFLLLPTENKKESVRICNKRIMENEYYDSNILSLNEKFIHSKCNYELSKNIIYTENKNYEEIINEIESKLL